jgi:hypothetical protein
MGRLLAAELSSEALCPIRESSGSHCPLHELVAIRTTYSGRGTQMEHPTTQAVSPQHPPSHTAFPYAVPHPADARHRALGGLSEKSSKFGISAMLESRRLAVQDCKDGIDDGVWSGLYKWAGLSVLCMSPCRY